jgi:hypothetical protein
MYSHIQKLLPLIVTALFVVVFVRLNEPKPAEVVTSEPIKTACTYGQEPPREITGYVCCFCNAKIDETPNDPVYITVAFNYDRGNDARDALYYFAHWYCLYKNLHWNMRDCMEERYLR